ncbi:hypothetical protein CF336_g9314, partial [Tilletia laevis]
LKPQDATSLAEEPGGSRSLSSTANTTQGPRFERADGLGPHAENEETFGASGPGLLPPELVEQLRVSGALATDAEIAGVLAIQLDADTRPGAQTFVNETNDLALHLKQSTLAPGTKANWDRVKSTFLSRSDTTTTAASAPSSSAAPVPSSSASVSVSASGNGSDGMEVDDDRGEEGRDSQGNVDEVLVSEQKLVTYLNCFVLHRNPKLSDEGLDTHVKAVVNLWETQVLKGVNTFPHPRNGALLKAFMKAVRRHRVQHSELLGEDAWRHSLNDGYTEDQHLEISQWYLNRISPIPSVASSNPSAAGDDDAATWRARFDFLMQHAIMGRSEDLRKAKLARLYTRTLPQSRPQSAPAFVVTIPRSKVNTEGRKEIGIAVRHRDVEACP